MKRLRRWVMGARYGTLRNDLEFAGWVMKLGADRRARAKVFAVALVMRLHDASPVVRHFGARITLGYRGRRFRWVVGCRSDFNVLWAVLRAGEYVYDLPEPKTVLDLGSHSGASLLHFRVSYPEARIVGIEPNPETFKRLKLNVAQLAGVEVHRLAIAPSDGPIPFYPGRQSALSSLEPTDGNRPIMVEGRTLPSLLRELGLERGVDLLKVDIEAGEDAVVRSAIGRAQAIVGEFHGGDGERFAGLFHGFDFRFSERRGEHPAFVAVTKDFPQRGP